VLTSCGAQVETAASGDEAVELIQRRRPDVLVSDIGLPGEDGYGLIRRVRALPAGADLPALALSAYAAPGDTQRAQEAGFQRHIAKPVEPAELAAMVAELAAAQRGQASGSAPTWAQQPPFALATASPAGTA